MDVIVGYHSVSKDRKPNEDRYRLLGGALVMPDDRVCPFVEQNRGQLFGVFDGAGGAPMGMKSATLAADSLVNFFTDEKIPATKSGIEEILLLTNQIVRSWGLMDGNDRPMGATTATVSWFAPDTENEVHIFHAGDTVAYRLNKNGLSTLTKDHGTGRGISNYVGLGTDLKLDIETFQFQPEDVLCLVSDGVTKGLNERQIQLILEDYLGEPHLAAKEMVEAAKRTGVQDDITSIVIELEKW